MKNAFINDQFFSQLETLALNLRTDLTGFFGGKHLVRTYGQTVEFADYREYMLGDDIRRIDWNLYSRFEKFFLKLFTDERQMHTQIFLDCSASMGKVNQTKGDYAKAIAAALGFLSVHNMDKVSYQFMNGNISVNPFETIVGKTSFFRAIGEVENMEFSGETNISECVKSCVDTGTKNGLSVIISDFLTDNDWKSAVDYLCYKGRQVMLIQVLAPEEVDPTMSGRVNLVDCETEDLQDARNMKIKITRSMQLAYQDALNEVYTDLHDFCVSRNVEYVKVQCDEPITKALFGELFKVGIMA